MRKSEIRHERLAPEAFDEHWGHQGRQCQRPSDSTYSTYSTYSTSKSHGSHMALAIWFPFKFLSHICIYASIDFNIYLIYSINIFQSNHVKSCLCHNCHIIRGGKPHQWKKAPTSPKISSLLSFSFLFCTSGLSLELLAAACVQTWRFVCTVAFLKRLRKKAALRRWL